MRQENISYRERIWRQQVKVIVNKHAVNKHADGYVAYPIETFESGVFETESPVLEVFVAEAGISRDTFMTSDEEV